MIKTKEVVYLGISRKAERIGAVTGKTYTFLKDKYKMPIATEVDERDYPALVSEKGKGCARRHPEALFMSKLQWDVDLQMAKTANR